MSNKTYPPCKAWSLLKKTLVDKESWDFWSIILRLQNKNFDDKFKATEDYYESILKYYCVGRKEKNEIFKLMEQTAEHYDVYDLFLQTFKAAYEKDTRKLSPSVIDLIVNTTKDEVLRDDYMKYLSVIRESLDTIKPEFYSQLNSPVSRKKMFSEEFEHELYHQFRLRDISMPKDNVMITNKGDNLLGNICKLSSHYAAHVNSGYEINLPIFIYSRDLVDSIKRIPVKYRSKLYEIVKHSDIICYYRSNVKAESNGTGKAVFACKTLSEVLNTIKETTNITK